MQSTRSLTFSLALAAILSVAAGVQETAVDGDASAASAASTADVVPAPQQSEREATLAAFIERDLFDAEFVTLGGGAGAFTARYERPTRLPIRGAVLIVPDIGGFVATEPMVEALGAKLPAGGWSMLAIQPPLLNAGAEISAHDANRSQWHARIRAGLAFLADEGIRAVVLAGHAYGAAAAHEALRTGALGNVVAVAGVGAWEGGIDDFDLPVLDVAGALDEAAVASSAVRHTRARQDGRRAYRRLLVEGARREFSGLEDYVAHRLRGWVESLAKDAATAGAWPG